ncbi:LOW QUALITY PROTEIN: hypothetical protein Cgig2_002907 [Carnegiea gigantea]|uniref:Uncharacterized protein n=1 Tax=Carnegiea gigantea TaxID=171969 RepID=A0A9Q1GS22_9CARY|nr:LOW QUALITY PROTEIN: hypothetical protein Cgig2_002907 [Carnegiea gigantea]
MTRSAQKAQVRGAQEVLTTEQGLRITVPTMVFGRKKAPRFTSPHNEPLVVEMKIASAIIRGILIDTESYVDIITWEFLKKLTYLGRDIKKKKKKNKMKNKEEQGKRGGLHIGLSTVLTTLIFRSPSISIRGVSRPIPCAITLTGRRNKLHLFRVLALVLGPLALVHVVEVGLEGDVLLKFSGQRHQDLVQISYCICTALLIALLLGLSRPFRPRAPPPAGAADLFSWPLGRPVQPSPFPVLLVASLSSLQHSAVALTSQANALAIVTSSLIILGGSEVPKAAKSQDLTKS